MSITVKVFSLHPSPGPLGQFLQVSFTFQCPLHKVSCHYDIGRPGAALFLGDRAKAPYWNTGAPAQNYMSLTSGANTSP